LRVKGVGFRFWGLGFRSGISGLEFRVWGLGVSFFLEFRFWVSVQGFGLRGEGCGFKL
jgi:hypothetical protein